MADRIHIDVAFFLRKVEPGEKKLQETGMDLVCSIDINRGEPYRTIFFRDAGHTTLFLAKITEGELKRLWKGIIDNPID